MLGAAHASAELVEIGEAEAVGAVYDDRVRVRDVHAALDDRRRDEHIRRAAHEFVHHFLQLVLVHLPVPDDGARTRHEHLDFRLHVLDVAYAVMQEEHLALPLQLALDRVADDAFVVRADERLDRDAVQRCGLDGAHVLRAHEREVERARDRRGREREHVHERPELFEFFFV